MADPKVIEFSAASTLPLAHEAAAAIGCPGADVEFTRLGENAIYRVAGAPLVLRIARSTDSLPDVRKEVRVARWLADEGLPAARIADETGDEPIVLRDRYPVTAWRLIRATAPDPDFAGPRPALAPAPRAPPPGVGRPAAVLPLRQGGRPARPGARRGGPGGRRIPRPAVRRPPTAIPRA